MLGPLLERVPGVMLWTLVGYWAYTIFRMVWEIDNNLSQILKLLRKKETE